MRQYRIKVCRAGWEFERVETDMINAATAALAAAYVDVGAVAMLDLFRKLQEMRDADVDEVYTWAYVRMDREGRSRGYIFREPQTGKEDMYKAIEITYETGGGNT